jgi:hypothetical protein
MRYLLLLVAAATFNAISAQTFINSNVIDMENTFEVYDIIKVDDDNIIAINNQDTVSKLQLLSVDANLEIEQVNEIDISEYNSACMQQFYEEELVGTHIYVAQNTDTATNIHKYWKEKNANIVLVDTIMYSFADIELKLIEIVKHVSGTYALTENLGTNTYELLRLNDTLGTNYTIENINSLPIVANDIALSRTSTDTEPEFYVAGSVDTNAFLMLINDEGEMKWRQTYAGTDSTSINDIELMGTSLFLVGSSSNYTSTDADGLVIKTDATGNIQDFVIFDFDYQDFFYTATSVEDTSLLLGGTSYLSGDTDPVITRTGANLSNSDLFALSENLPFNDGGYYFAYFDTISNQASLVGYNQNNLIISLYGAGLTGVKSVGIEEITVYPNPATTIINIPIENSFELRNISVYDAAGRLVLNKTNTFDTELNISSLQNGIYTIKVQSKSSISSGLFMVR